MVFASGLFLFIFLPIAIAGSLIVRKRLRGMGPNMVVALYSAYEINTKESSDLFNFS